LRQEEFLGIFSFPQGANVTPPKAHQISFKLAAGDYAETQAGTDFEQISVADFSRKLHRAALVLYKKCGGLREMRDLVDRLPESPREIPIRGHNDHGKKR
jgi:hypothetical protein